VFCARAWAIYVIAGVAFTVAMVWAVGVPWPGLLPIALPLGACRWKWLGTTVASRTASEQWQQFRELSVPAERSLVEAFSANGTVAVAASVCVALVGWRVGLYVTTPTVALIAGVVVGLLALAVLLRRAR
jgi:hypothetical protein